MDINKLVQDLSKGLDNLFTSDEERLKYGLKMAELKYRMLELESGVQKALVERSKGSKLPDRIGYMLMGALFVDLFARPILAKYGFHFTDMDEAMLFGSLMALIGVNKFKK